MIYYLLLFSLIVGSIIEFINKKTFKYIYIIIILILAFLLCFRFGQGTDYLSYYSQYRLIPTKLNSFMQNYKDYHGEIGWLFTIFISNKIGLNFETFNFIMSLIMILLLNRTLRKYSPLKICSCLLFFPAYYLTYCFSGIRQGLCLCVFLGFGLELLFKKKYIKYFLLIILLSLLHKSVYSLFILPFIMMIDLEKYEKYLYSIPIFSFAFFYFGIFEKICNTILGYNAYLDISISLPAIIVRILYYIIIRLLHSKVKKSNNNIENKLFNIYMFGFYMFIGLSFTATLSQRLTMPMKAVEIILIPLQLFIMYSDNKIAKEKTQKRIFNNKQIITICSIIVLLIPIVEMHKNINAYLEQGKYKKNYNSFEYPYVSIFEKEKICDYIEDFNCDTIK